MADFPQPESLPLFISTYTNPGSAEVWKTTTNTVTLTSQTWAGANQAMYIPFWLPWPYPVNRVFWGVGSVVASSNFDFGIYSKDGTRLYSTTSTAAGSASTLQYVTPSTTFVLVPGRYYFAFVNNGTTNRAWGASGNANLHRLGGILQQTSALPLPATATFALNTATVYPLCGITRTASGF